MVDRELTEREDARMTTRLKAARLRHNACLEDIDYRSPVAWTRPWSCNWAAASGCAMA